jgi:hypothetical protein
MDSPFVILVKNRVDREEGSALSKAGNGVKTKVKQL